MSTTVHRLFIKPVLSINWISETQVWGADKEQSHRLDVCHWTLFSPSGKFLEAAWRGGVSKFGRLYQHYWLLIRWFLERQNLFWVMFMCFDIFRGQKTNNFLIWSLIIFIFTRINVLLNIASFQILVFEKCRSEWRRFSLQIQVKCYFGFQLWVSQKQS